MPSVLDSSELLDRLKLAGYPAGTAAAVGVSGPFGQNILATLGRTPDGVRFTPGTIVYAGSLAKQVTAGCAALLVQSGRLDTRDSITKWLTELPEWAKEIRVHHLIHHTADLPDETTVWDEMQRSGVRDRTSPDILAALGRLSDHHANPGASNAYSNWGYVCLATIIERVASQTLAAFADEHFFTPLGMSRTCFWAGPEPKPPAGSARKESLAPAPLSLGDGGLWTTLYDLLRWSDGLNYRTLGIADMLHTPGTLDDGTPLDYAWGVRVFEHGGCQIQSHGGSWSGSTAKLLRLPQYELSIAAVALDGDVERMVALTGGVQERLLKLMSSSSDRS